VRVELAHETLVGTAVDLSDEGLLVLATGPDGARRTVAAGDVVHLRPSGGGGHPTGGTGTGPSGGGGGPN
jgi:BirA family biotin operon repressor/biotin-[acetyl-CoA-carboxylase] ligase